MHIMNDELVSSRSWDSSSNLYKVDSVVHGNIGMSVLNSDSFKILVSLKLYFGSLLTISIV